MFFDEVIGQSRAKKIIKRLLASGRLPHALLLHGPEGIGKKAMAIRIAMAVNCLTSEVDPCGACNACRKLSALGHPDLTVLYPRPATAKPEEEADLLRGLAENPYRVSQPARNLTIPMPKKRAQELRRRAALRPFEAKRKVVLIFDVDYMPDTVNALLKTLEEPPNEMLFVLTTSRPGSVLPTILSRCQPLGLRRLSAEDIEQVLLEQGGADVERARLTAKLADGNLTRAYEMLDSGDLEQGRDAAFEFLRISMEGTSVQVLEWAESCVKNKKNRPPEQLMKGMLLWIRDAFLQLQGIPDGATNLDRTTDVVWLAGMLDDRTVEHVLSEIEVALERIARNVNLQLVLLHVMSGLRKNR
ncbi:MAG: DNA polymerase III subunit [Candidatus Latescibacteria bacterium]|nr:DNA polymerase III subunit [Candidatus Latescibacterota bacterium]